MDSRKTKILWFGISTTIIAGMVYFADVGKFLEAIAMANGWYLIPAFAFGLSVFIVWSYVWYSFFETMKLGVGYFKSLSMFMAGFFMNSITPVGQFGGEPLMAYIVSRNTEAEYEEAFSTVLSADIINAVPPFTFVLGGSLYLLAFGSINQLVVQAVYMALLATVVGGALVYLLWFEAGKIEGAIIRAAKYISNKLGRGKGLAEKIEEKLRRVEESFRTIGESPRHLLELGVIAHLGFLLNIGCMYFILLSVGIDANIAPLYFVLALGSLGSFAPTPGGSGAFEAVMAGLLTVFVPITFASALVVAIIFRLTTFWPGLLIGYFALNALENGGKK